MVKVNTKVVKMKVKAKVVKMKAKVVKMKVKVVKMKVKAKVVKPFWKDEDMTDQDLMYFRAIKFGSRITISELSFSL